MLRPMPHNGKAPSGGRSRLALATCYLAFASGGPSQSSLRILATSPGRRAPMVTANYHSASRRSDRRLGVHLSRSTHSPGISKGGTPRPRSIARRWPHQSAVPVKMRHHRCPQPFRPKPSWRRVFCEIHSQYGPLGAHAREFAGFQIAVIWTAIAKQDRGVSAIAVSSARVSLQRDRASSPTSESCEKHRRPGTRPVTMVSEG
jgi:hypothetical protein